MMEHVNQLEKNVLVIGSTVCDILIRVDHLPSVEEDVNPESQQMALGGCAFNVWNMLRLFQVPALLYSPVGTGLYGEYVRSQLNQIHIIHRSIPKKKTDAATVWWIVMATAPLWRFMEQSIIFIQNGLPGWISHRLMQYMSAGWNWKSQPAPASWTSCRPCRGKKSILHQAQES